MDSIRKKLEQLKTLERQGASEPTRLISFADAVFSVAVTLSVVEILPPDLNEKILSIGGKGVLALLWPKMLGIVLTFLVIAIFWLSHHRIFKSIKRVDTQFIQMNLLFLLFMSFMPFAIKFSGAHSTDKTAAVFYSGFMAITGLLLHLMWRYASSNFRLIPSDTPSELIRFSSIRTLVPSVIFAGAALIAFFDPEIARYAWYVLLFSRRISTLIYVALF